MITRRSFISALAAAAAAVAVPLKLRWPFKAKGPDIVVKAGEFLALPAGKHGWVVVYGFMVAQGATIERLDIMAGGAVDFETHTLATFSRGNEWSVAVPRPGDFVRIG